ncbi:TetR/AcrR family transcriptional regulator [Streptomyces sp. NPDC051907]|uniref:TetR/AcrR family transcriptional regulator n=1 Tax=Streptomyces sp. NPDC051907 TaxID=3155284 RepID=UPI00343262D9
MTDQGKPSARGRPRDRDIDQAIVSATLELLGERGYADLTIGAVATRAGVGRPTVYVRFADKNALVVHALVQTVPPLRTPDTGNALHDLIELAVDFVARLANSPAGRTVLAVHAEAGRHPELEALLREHYLRPRERLVHDLIQQGQQRGQLREDLTPEDIQDLLCGPLIYHWLIHGDLADGQTRALLDAASRAITA